MKRVKKQKTDSTNRDITYQSTKNHIANPPTLSFPHLPPLFHLIHNPEEEEKIIKNFDKQV